MRKTMRVTSIRDGNSRLSERFRYVMATGFVPRVSRRGARGGGRGKVMKVVRRTSAVLFSFPPMRVQIRDWSAQRVIYRAFVLKSRNLRLPGVATSRNPHGAHSPPFHLAEGRAGGEGTLVRDSSPLGYSSPSRDILILSSCSGGSYVSAYVPLIPSFRPSFRVEGFRPPPPGARARAPPPSRSQSRFSPCFPLSPEGWHPRRHPSQRRQQRLPSIPPSLHVVAPVLSGNTPHPRRPHTVPGPPTGATRPRHRITERSAPRPRVWHPPLPPPPIAESDRPGIAPTNHA